MDWYLTQLSSEELHLTTDENRCFDPQPHIRQNSRNPVEDERNDYRSQRCQGQSKKTHQIKEPALIAAYRN